jgi:signal transduction histidine kinase
VVRDTGIGLYAEEQQVIFNRFHRATEARSTDGNGVGLGLSIALSIAEAHNGRIQVMSIKGHGSTFSVYLPVS